MLGAGGQTGMAGEGSAVALRGPDQTRGLHSRLLTADCAGESPLLRKPALPFAETLLVASPASQTMALPGEC